MAHASPLKSLHQHAEASLRTYGPPGPSPELSIELVETFGDLDLEYAALRKHCVLIDQPHRAVIEVTGKDRLDLLNRMVTQELKGMPPFSVRRAFLLNRKGRIDADLRIIDLPSRTLLDLDAHAVDRTLKSLSDHVIADDVTLRNVTQQTHRLALHGPTGPDLLRALAEFASGADASGPALPDLSAGRACAVKLSGHEVVVDRDDSTGETGLELTIPAAQAVTIYQQLVENGTDHDSGAEALNPARARSLSGRVRLRCAGWHAFNMARIEAGTPLYHIDFGPDSLPAETGVLEQRVSFTKGCYLGQEIVARMHSRGHSKHQLVGLKLERRIDPATKEPFQPESGAFVHLPARDGTPGDAVGIITSSTVSPMLGATVICFARVKQEHIEPDTALSVAVGQHVLGATVQPALTFWRR